MNPKTSRQATTSGGTRRGRQGLTPRRVAVLVLAAIVLVFVFENTQHTRIRLLVLLVTMPLWLALLGTGLIGALCGALLVSRRQ
ncbi:LapA family protein [Streptomyces sp. NPDC051104]|uniref:LapA family protein n=1 Tax=Streptomyces sp. NPDC051104 TaxID=3155044 RepID=UPI0034383000